MSNNPYQNFGGIELQFFTQEGMPTGKPIPLDYTEAMLEAVTPSCVFIYVTPEDGSSRRVFLDWNGKVLFRLAYEDYMGSVPTMIEMEDGLVFAGCSPDYPANYLKWGRRALRSARVRTNGTFGSVMCLCPDGRKTPVGAQNCGFLCPWFRLLQEPPGV